MTWRDKAELMKWIQVCLEIMEPSDWEFKINIESNMLEALVEKVDNFQEQMDNENREIETLRKNIQEIVE